MPRMAPFGSNFCPVLVRLALGDRPGALEDLRALVGAGEYRVMFDPVLFADIADDPEYQRLMNIMAARRAEQRDRLAAMEDAGELAALPPSATLGSDSVRVGQATD